MKRRITSLILSLVLALTLSMGNASAAMLTQYSTFLTTSGNGVYRGNSTLTKNLKRLSSGLLINRAASDAAALAISEKMRADITAAKVSLKSAEDYVGLVQTSEGALQDVHAMLRRMVELAAQSANASYGDAKSSAQQDLAILEEQLRLAKNSFENVTSKQDSRGHDLDYFSKRGFDSVPWSDTFDIDLYWDWGSSSSYYEMYCGIHPVDAEGEHDKATCGEHYKCAPGDHNNMATCGEHYLCEPGEHNNMATCGEHYMCEHGDNEDCRSKSSIGMAPCGNHPADAEGEHDMAACGEHYMCEPGEHDQNAQCDMHPICAHGDNTNCSEHDSTGIFITRLEDGSIFAGFQFDGGVMALVGEENPVDNAAEQTDLRRAPSLNYSQFATEGGYIYGSSNPRVVMVAPNGDMAVVGSGNASVETFSEQGDFLNGWNLESDGEILRFASQLAIILNGEPVTSITMQQGDTAQLGVAKVEGDVIAYDGENSAMTAASSAEDAGDMTGNSAGMVMWQENIKNARIMGSNPGVSQVRLDYKINNLEVSTENITAAESRIRDVDMAEEITNYTKNNILLQASQAMLAQANTIPQGVLDLLQ